MDADIRTSGTVRRANTWRVRGAIGALTAIVVTLSGLAFVAPAASADSAPAVGVEETVTADPLPTAQIDGVVWAQAIAGNTVFAGGEFTTARPAGAAAGVDTVPRANLMAYNLTTGAMTSWNPGANGAIKTIVASPDGSRIYVGGSFTTIAGKTRYRVAAFDAATGDLLPWAPYSNAQVTAIATNGNTVFIGGNFTSLAGGSRTRLGAVSATTAALLPLTATLSGGYGVTSLVANPDGTKIVVAGSFTSTNGSTNPGRGMAALDATTGASMPWAVNSLINNAGTGASITALATDGTSVYGSGYSYGSAASDKFEGTFRANWSDGALVWLEDCHGDTYSLAVSSGVEYKAGHTHYCGNIGGFPQTSPTWTFQHSTAYATAYHGNVATADIYGYKSFAGQPAATPLHWFPDWQVGTYTGKSQATWQVAANDDYVIYGGEFLAVNGKQQQGIVRFAKKSAAPNKSGPEQSGTTFPITAASLRAGEVRLSWVANTDRDNATLTYQVFRQDKGTTVPIYTTTADSNFYTTPRLTYVDSTAVPGQTYNYRVRAIDPMGNQATGAWTTVTAATTNQASDYELKVLDDGAMHFWPLSDTAVTSAADWTGTSNLTVNSATRGTSGPNLAAASTATTFGGSSVSYASTTSDESGLNVLTIEAWFKTSSTTGGKIVGFGNKSTGGSTSYDRHIYIDGSGRVTFGVYPGAQRTISTGTGYNNGQWHYVVGTLSPSGMSFYVDGVRIGSRVDTISAQTYNGYWRVGGDTVGSWANAGSSSYLNGSIADVAIYNSALTRAQIDAHWVSSGRSSVLPAAPSEAYGKAVYKLEPTLYWRAGEASGSVASDSGLDGQTGTYYGAVTKGTAGALTGVLNSAITLAPTKIGNTWIQTGITSDKSYANPTTFAVEGWFKTNTTTGGKLIGFGSARTGQSSNYDRHIYMTADGKVNFGVYNGSQVIVSSAAGYNNNQWHYVVGQLSSSGMQLYIDGVLVGTNANTAVNSYTGYWRVGGDNGWSGDTYWKGSIDEVAVYPAPLTASQVLAHYQQGALGFVNQAPTPSFSSIVTDLAVAFDGSGSTDPDNAITSYQWSFGDGGTATGATVNHTYAAPGTYEVTLKTTDQLGATASLTQEVTALAPNLAPAAVFMVSADKLKISVDGSASADPDGSITTYSWAFGDGSTGAGATGQHTFAEAGTYTVSLTVTDDRGSSATTSQDVTVVLPPNQLPTAAFTAQTTAMTVAVDASASADPDGNVASYAWDFGDGTTGSGATASHTYAMPGAYEVSLTVVDDRGGEATSTKSVTAALAANQTPTASIETDTSDLSVSVDGSASSDPDGTIVSYAWDFGDGATGSGASATHDYESAGVYTVTLTVTDDRGGVDTASTQVDVSVSDVIAEDLFERTATNGWGSADVGGAWTVSGSAARFSVAAGSGVLTLTSSSTQQATLGSVSSANTLLSTSFSVDKIANAQYLYFVGRQVGSDQYQLRARVAVDGSVMLLVMRGGTAIGASYTVPGLTLTPGAKYNVAFEVKGTSPTTLSAKLWKSGDAEPAAWQVTRSDSTAALQAAGGIGLGSYVPTSAAAYPVTVRYAEVSAIDPTVTPTPSNTLPTAAFTPTMTNLSVAVDAAASTDPDGSIASYAWTFGDGSTGTGVTASHSYATPGTYTVALTVTDNRGGKATVTHEVIASAQNQPPTAAFTAEPTDLSLAVDGSTSTDPEGAALAYAWAFGDGATAAGATATHEYAAGGTYTVKLTVTDANGAKDSATKQVTVSAPHVNEPPVAAFTASSAGLTLSVDGSGSSDPEGGALSYAWDFGDGATATGATATHAYAAGGTYSVVLTVTDPKAATNSSTQQVSVEPPAPVDNVIAQDLFERTASGGWGTADRGGAWTVSSGAASAFSIANGAGVMRIASSTALQANLSGVSSGNTVLTATFTVDKIANGQYVQLVGRAVGGDQYILRARIASDGTVMLYTLRGGTAIGAGVTVPGLTLTAGTAYTIAFSVKGTSPTTLAGKMWKAADPEPTTWLVSRTDSTAALQAAGSVGLYSYVPTSAAAYPVSVAFTEVTAIDPTKQ